MMPTIAPVDNEFEFAVFERDEIEGVAEDELDIGEAGLRAGCTVVIEAAAVDVTMTAVLVSETDVVEAKEEIGVVVDVAAIEVDRALLEDDSTVTWTGSRVPSEIFHPNQCQYLPTLRVRIEIILKRAENKTITYEGSGRRNQSTRIINQARRKCRCCHTQEKSVHRLSRLNFVVYRF
jgi:hypothetical protein